MSIAATCELVTTGEVRRRHPGVPEHAVRRAVDALGLVAVRAGLYRLIAEDDLPRLKQELERKGYIQKCTDPAGGQTSGADDLVRSRSLARPGGGHERHPDAKGTVLEQSTH